MSRKELLTAAGLRQDNRRPYELRQLELSILSNPLAGADGAASASHGLTRVMALVYGPHDVSPAAGADFGSAGTGHAGGEEGKARISVSISTTPFSSQNRKSVARTDKRNVELAVAIANTFEPAIMLGLYPRSTIDVCIEVLQQDGGLLQAAVNAATLALIAAGVSLMDYVTALSVAALSSPTCPLVDVSAAEESDLSHLTVATLPRRDKVTLVQMEARLSVERFDEILRLGVEGCATLRVEMEKEVRRWSRNVARMRTLQDSDAHNA